MMTKEELQKLMEKVSVDYFGKRFMHFASFNNRLRTTGGRYIVGNHNIEINPKYLVEFDEVALVDIIKHELCHYHLHVEGKGFKHKDYEFRKLLQEVGASMYCKPLPSILEAKNKRVLKQYLYKCTKCGLVYKRRRKVNTNKYNCGKCFSKLRMIEVLAFKP